MRGDTNFIGSDASGPSVYFLISSVSLVWWTQQPPNHHSQQRKEDFHLWNEELPLQVLSLACRQPTNLFAYSHFLAILRILPMDPNDLTNDLT